MTSIELGKKSQKYNQKYKQLFGCVPHRDDYDGTSEDFLNGLILATEIGVELDKILHKRKPPTGSRCD